MSLSIGTIRTYLAVRQLLRDSPMIPEVEINTAVSPNAFDMYLEVLGLLEKSIFFRAVSLFPEKAQNEFWAWYCGHSLPGACRSANAEYGNNLVFSLKIVRRLNAATEFVGVQCEMCGEYGNFVLGTQSEERKKSEIVV